MALTDERRRQGQRSNQQAARATWPVHIPSMEFLISLNPPGVSFDWRETLFAVFTVVPPSLSVLVCAGKTAERLFQTLLLPPHEGKEISTPLHYVASFLLLVVNMFLLLQVSNG